ncbi:hypothetical protein [Tenggerimyces flavus]|uniref:Uncharacterized protein n=1 Tax=Tenggerimyces flavus TaxID=1708749 RepID=A0ABV7YAU8_9ACTN|nr:hypothetical protein [Tenggerimyces flavus]MBM7789122.1 hypothetical protein [Tenggerimyces flavus]
MSAGMKTWVRKVTVLAGMSAALVAGGLVGTGPAMAQPAEVAPLAVNCVDAGPPSPNFYRDSKYLNPNACAKCRERGTYLESTGRWDAHCQNLYNPAGTLTAVGLWLRCVACRPTTAVLLELG